MSKVVAVLALVGGVGEVAVGIAVAFKLFTWDRAGGASAVPSGELIGQGLYLIIFALVLGTVAEIGVALQRAYHRD